MTLAIRPAVFVDADVLAPVMRPEDVAEVYAAAGHGPYRALVEGINVSRESYAGVFDGELGAIFGIAVPGHGGRVAIPWLLGSPVLERHPKEFHRAAWLFVAVWLERYGNLEQMVDARHTTSLRWLRHLGFKVEAPHPWGYEGRPFCRVHLSEADSV